MADFSTSDTPLATYLVQEGHSLLKIVYERRLSGKLQATFVFTDTPELQERVNLFNTGKAVINLALYEHTKSSLIDRIMRGQQ